ncbi:BZ3500_MvSof-1268-A1-R1_Chr11-2g03416 [Microbotryum saponariae]|uniref:BZ3500_MvSof-1268-A1-R1_Chr11-2g03416 protein n=1 Tax=Microbotryum saponariae TaxID=289078 RepID=A0A2X0MM18_9BASI|nr:BZ3500_MvSof-1268-A1-R1_Chr11-2g03416 [Microbotryum saponariae]SDA03330.1 BZ3501_MvSof-1269-A2-R1_Chr11g02987 [Microbotryum saponariae]
MVEGTTLRCGRHAKQVVGEAESHVPGRFDGKWNLGERRRNGLSLAAGRPMLKQSYIAGTT